MSTKTKNVKTNVDELLLTLTRERDDAVNLARTQAEELAAAKAKAAAVAAVAVPTTVVATTLLRPRFSVQPSLSRGAPNGKDNLGAQSGRRTAQIHAALYYYYFEADPTHVVQAGLAMIEAKANELSRRDYALLHPQASPAEVEAQYPRVNAVANHFNPQNNTRQCAVVVGHDAQGNAIVASYFTRYGHGKGSTYTLSPLAIKAMGGVIDESPAPATETTKATKANSKSKK